ncbi:MAG: translocation/assembly module TamB [Sphingobacteriales bacterium]|nr:MAG: translocation/assembly module TamB [Sphingobacteriales bacterium]
MKKALKIFLYILGGILGLVLIAVVLLLTPPGKELVRSKAESFLQKKLKTTVRVGKLDYSLPKWLELGDVLFLDQQKDTLISAGTLRVDIAMLKLINGTVQVNKINFENGVAHIYRIAPDTTFNFDFIVKAFSSPSAEPKPEKEKPADTSGGLVLDIRELALKNIRFNFDDYTGGSRFGVSVNELEAKINKTDINKMDFGLKRLYVNGLHSTFALDTSYLPVDTDTTTSPMPMLAADELDLNDVSFEFNNKLDKMLFSIGLKKLLAHPQVIDLNTQYVTLKDVLLDTTNIKVVMGKKEVTADKAEEVVDSAVAKKWKVLAGTIRLNGINFAMDDENAPKQQYGIDYSHLDVRNLALDLDQLLYTTDTIAGNLKHLAVQEKSGFNLKEFKTQFAYYPQGAYLTNLYLETANTILQDKLVVKYPSLDALKTQMGLMQLQLQLKNSVVGMADVLIFAPQLRSQEIFKRYGNDKLKVNAAIDGFVNALNIKQFQLSGFGGTYVDINGKLNGLPDADKLNYNLAIKRLQSQKSTVMAFMPASVKQQIDLPNSFNITGRVSGNVKDYNTDLLATTTDGNAVIKGKILMSPGAGKERYDVIIKTQSLNLGKILRKDSLMGRITANISAKGQSFDVNYMNAMLKGEILSAGFMGYNYKAINFDATVAKKVAKANLVSNDPNAVLTLNADADLNGKYPALVAKLVIDSMDLQALKLYKEELKVRTTVDANLPELNPDYPRGIVNINKPQVVMAGARYYLDSIYLSSQPSVDTGNFIVLDADAIQAVIMGKTPLSKVGTIIQERIDKYYTMKADSTKAIAAAKKAVTDTTTIPADYNLSLSAVIRDRPLLHILVPGLKQLDTVKIDGGLTPADMYLNVLAPKVQYNDMYLYNAKANVQGRDSDLTYDVTLDRFKQNNFEFWYSKVNGSLYNQTIDANVSIADSTKRERFALGATYSQRDTQKLSLKPGLMLNYKTWQVAQPNVVVFGTDGFYVQNFLISNGGESISINSETPQFSAPIVAAINNFLLSNVTEIVSGDTLLANGVLNMNMRLQDLAKQPKASGTLNVNNLSVLNDTIGNLDLQLTEASATAINSRIAINGRGNDLVVTGFYYPKPVNGNNFDLDMEVNAINLQTMEGLAQRQIRNTSGYIRGSLKIQGTMDAPKVIGELRTDNLATTPTMLGAPLKFPKETIAFTPSGIEFRNFRIVDSLGNEGTIDGKIITTNYRDMKLALNVKTDKLQVMNSGPKDNDLFYGKMLVSSDLKISGTAVAPNVDGNLTIHDSTKFTVVLPQTQAGIQERDGIVEFVNMSDTKQLAIKDTVPKFAARKGVDLNMNVAIEKNAEFSVVIDQGTGDFLRVRGEASLSTTVRPDGSIGLTGAYELTDGEYQLNYNLIKRKFRIQKGSTITFAGDPLDADVNITAIYDANIAPYDLVTKQVSDPAQLVYYKQRLPFQVQLNMKGSLMKPAIGFDVVLPTDKPLNVSSDVSSLVQAKLSQIRNNASEMNKQVFAVLILGRFVSENPFESGAGGGGAEYMVRQSASRFIGDQLNKFADQLVQGLELTFDLQSTEDYTTGAKRNRTDLNVAASKRLLNDRLTLTVGNNFELEGQNQNKNQTTSLIPGNLAADYTLSEDGRYMVRIYRRNQMEDILQGFVVQTGTNFIVTLDYNRFRNVFRNRRQNKENRQNNREMQKMEADDRTTKGTSN